MVYIFDLDDTLYPEMTYIYSGFSAVADFLKHDCGLDSHYAYHSMLALLAEHGRGHVFNMLLEKNGALSSSRVKKCISVYRTHLPILSFYEDAASFLDEIKNEPVYIVTDGNKFVQNIKCESLKLDKIARKIFITHRYGIKNAKPSPYCFMKICELEKIQPKKAVYFGDNPYKDFVAIKQIGFRTVRMLRGTYKDVMLSNAYDAETSVRSFNEFCL